MNEFFKAAQIEKTAAVDEGDLALINALARRSLKAEEVYTFPVRLCDNEVDRDFERFSRPALEKLAELFVGKCGIFDHQWTAMGQTARLYKTEVVDETTVTSAGDSQCYLKGWAYMLRGEETEPLIAQIEAGIKKEVSVGCAVARSVCSICGQEAGRCAHRRGREYDGQLCYFTLEDPTDAYEWSFVAVPAQRSAGIIKSKRYGGGAPEGPPGGEPGSDTWQDEALLELEKSRFMEVTSNET